MFFPITTQASISVIIISVLVIIVGVLMIAVVVGFVLFVHCERAAKYKINGGYSFSLKLTMVLIFSLINLSIVIFYR